MKRCEQTFFFFPISTTCLVQSSFVTPSSICFNTHLVSFNVYYITFEITKCILFKVLPRLDSSPNPVQDPSWPHRQKTIVLRSAFSTLFHAQDLNSYILSMRVHWQTGITHVTLYICTSVLRTSHRKGTWIKSRCSPACHFPGCIRNLGVIPGYMAVTGCMVSDTHPRTMILTNSRQDTLGQVKKSTSWSSGFFQK